MAIENPQWTAEEIAIFKSREPDAKPFRVNMIYKKSMPRIVNVRVTEKGVASPEFMRWLFDRLEPGAIVQVPNNWITQRFERVQ